jgi:hypothetical protein
MCDISGVSCYIMVSLEEVEYMIGSEELEGVGCRTGSHRLSLLCACDVQDP